MDESVVASDGFMLNILSVLQELSMPIKKDKVDAMSLFNVNTTMIEIKDDEAKINCSRDEFLKWIDSISSWTLILPLFKFIHSILIILNLILRSTVYRKAQL